MSQISNFSHKYIEINKTSKNLYKVVLKQYSKTWTKFLDDSLEYSDDFKCWIVNDDDIKEFIDLVKNANYDKRREETDESEVSDSYSESETSDSDMDDEMIQKALARRLTSESKMLDDDREYISDSEMEDMISLCRRIRFLYKSIKSLNERVKQLEK
jgi:hypothetical protein